MRQTTKIRAEAIAGAFAGALVLAGLASATWIKIILIAFTVGCLVVAAAPSLAIKLERLWAKRGDDPEDLKHRSLALSREITGFVDEQRRLPSRGDLALETNQIYRKRFEGPVWLVVQELERAGYGDELLSRHLQQWESGDEFEAAADLSDIEDIASRLRLVAERIGEEPTPRQIFQSLQDVHRKLDSLVLTAPRVALISGAASGKATARGILTGVATASDEGTGVEKAELEAAISASDEGHATEEAKVEKEEEIEKIFLAAPLLTDEEEAALRDALSRVPGKVGFTAEEFMVEEMEGLAKVFREAKWEVIGTKVGRFQEPVVDIIVEACSEDAAYAGFVQGAMKAVGIDAMGAIVPSLPKDQIEIVVGNTTAKPARPSISRR